MISKDSEHTPIWELNPIWNLLTPGEKTYISQELEIVSYKKNATIYKEDSEAKHVMMLIKGKVRVYKEGVGQKPQIIRMLKPYDLFGYRAIVAGDRHGSWANTVENSEICQIPKEAFLALLKRNSAFCFAMFEDMARYLAVSERRSINLTQKHIRGRLAESLLTLKQQYGMDEDEVTIAMYISREDLASLSNMTTSNAIRTLSQLAQEGIISLDGKKIKLLNEQELIRISQQG